MEKVRILYFISFVWTEGVHVCTSLKITFIMRLLLFTWKE